MPELPEVQTVVNSLQILNNKVFKSFNPIWNKVSYNHPPSKIIKIIKSKKINSISRIGKNIILKIDNEYIIFHLRMTGYLYYSKSKPSKKKHISCYFIFNDNSYLIFEDIRKFGGFYYYKNLQKFHTTIGIDPFDKSFNSNWLKKNIILKKRQIKSLLLDQKFICGLGNIYIDEILWKTRVHPLQNSSKLDKNEINLLYKNIMSTLNQSIKHHGTTIINFKFDDMRTGNYRKKLKVYNRQDKHCYMCKNIIIKMKISGRGTHICSKCQTI